MSGGCLSRFEMMGMERQPENVLCGFRLLLLVGCATWLRTRLGIFCLQAALMIAANGSCYGGVQGLLLLVVGGETPALAKNK